MKRYAVWGKDKTYPYLWVACLVAGIEAAKERYKQAGRVATPKPCDSVTSKE